MPQISRVRIVNFQYNDGKRLIADELYDFSSQENENALNILINLANGGGKSVMVQLMLQPILPKAKVSDRNIESFFQKSSDHCFVLLEWMKDNSKERMLTGIAMASSNIQANELDDSKGRSIKYYTFYTEYQKFHPKYDIANMELSKNEGGRFIPADFDFVRSISKKSGGMLKYYSSEDKQAWANKISEYGIIQNEWRMIE